MTKLEQLRMQLMEKRLQQIKMRNQLIRKAKENNSRYSSRHSFLSIIILIKDFMKTKKVLLTADNILKLAIVVGIFLVALSFTYYFIIRPISNDFKIEECLKETKNRYHREECLRRY